MRKLVYSQVHIRSLTTTKEAIMEFEQTFMNFLLEHQERHRRTGHFLVLMDAIISAAKHIEHYYITGALKGHLGLAGKVNVQGEDVMHMDDMAHEIIIHYLKTTQAGDTCGQRGIAMRSSS